MSYNYEFDTYELVRPGPDSSIPYYVFPAELYITGSIDAANYNYELDSYDTEETVPVLYVNYTVYPKNPDNYYTDLEITGSVDAAASSLRLGTDVDETQNIEIGTSAAVTTIYGPVAFLQGTNASSMSLTYDLNVSGKTNLENVACNALTVTTIGNATSGTTVSGTLKTDTIESTGSTTKLSIGGNITNGEINIGRNVNGALSAIQIGDTQTTGVIQIGGAANRSGTIYIGNSMNSGDITIGKLGSTTNINNKLYVPNYISAGGTYVDATINAMGTSPFPVQIACRPYDSNTTNIMNFFPTGGGSITRGSITATANSVAYITSSDRRLKKNVEEMPPMLDTIMKLNPCQYDWVVDDSKGFGFIAQEVHKILPQFRNELYDMNNDDLDDPIDKHGNPIHYGLDYGNFTPYIIKAVQEMKLDYETKIQELDMQLHAEKQKTTDLQSSLDALLARVNALEQRP